MTKLLPCPFCGKGATPEYSPRNKSWSVACLYCGAGIGGFDSQQTASDRWNTRAGDTGCDARSVRAATIEECAKLIEPRLSWDESEHAQTLRQAAAEIRALSREDQGGWQVSEIEQALILLLTAAKLMPRATPAPGGASTVHNFPIEAAYVWGLDRACKAAEKALAVPSATREDQGGGA